MEELIEHMRKYLEKRGLDKLKHHEEVIIYIISILLNVSIIVGLFFLIPNLIVSVIVATTFTVSSTICYFLMESADVDDVGIILNFIGLLPIPCAFVAHLVVLPFIPYRGNNEMKLREIKLKRLSRKARINKYKFWK